MNELLNRADEIAERTIGKTHWENCWDVHDSCLIVALATRVRELESDLLGAIAIIEREGNRNDALNRAKDENRLLRELVCAIVENRTCCYIPTEGGPEALLEWDERANAALAKEKA